MSSVPRIDDDASRTHGWQARVHLPGGKRLTKFFSDAEHGGKVKALALAERAAESMSADLHSTTPWFPRSQKPVREGRYQARLARGWSVVYLVYRGGRWCLDPWGPFERHAVDLRAWPGFQWRGLVKDPAA